MSEAILTSFGSSAARLALDMKRGHGVVQRLCVRAPFFSPTSLCGVLVFAGGSVKDVGEFSNFCILEDVEGCNVLK